MIHHALIKQVQLDFTCKERLDHHALVQSYLDIFRSWQKNKNYNAELHINKNAQILFTAVMLESGIKGIHVTKKLPCITSPLRGHSAFRQHMMQRKRKTEDKKAALLLLRSVLLCFEGYCALTASKSSASAFKPQNSPRVLPDQASSLTGKVKLLKFLYPVTRLKHRDDGKHAKVLQTDKRHRYATARVNVSFHTIVSKMVKRRSVSCESTANE